VLDFFLNMRRRGIRITWADFELCCRSSGTAQNNESKRCQAAEIPEHIIKLLLIAGAEEDRSKMKGMTFPSDCYLYKPGWLLFFQTGFWESTADFLDE
jgi:hypothetical protein